LVKPTTQELEFINSCRVGRLATVDEERRPHLIPVCYVFSGGIFYTPIDNKPKRAKPSRLKRMRNISANPNVAVVIDRWSEDWERLGYVFVSGRADIISTGGEYRRSLGLLEAKYPQYERMNLGGLGLPVIKIVPDRLVSWGALGG